MRASTRLRVSGPTSAHARTTFETVMTDTLRSRAMSFRRTGDLVGVGMIMRGAGGVGLASLQPEREYNKLRAQAWPRKAHRRGFTFQPSTSTTGAALPRSLARYVAATWRLSPGSNGK